jgi:enterobactin synthetase component D
MSKTFLNETFPITDHPFWIRYLSPPFSIPNIQFFAITYHPDEVDFTHPCISQIEIPEPLAKAVHKKKAEYVTGRYCAHKALSLIEIDGSVGRYSDQSPKWPPSLIRSITHTHYLSMAAVGYSRDYIGIGIDSEMMISSVKMGALAEQFITLEEYNLAAIYGLPSEVWLYLVFSAKESVYKSLYPSVKRFFGFFDVKIVSVSRTDTQRGILAVQLTTQLGCFEKGFLLSCSYLINEPYVHTYVLL